MISIVQICWQITLTQKHLEILYKSKICDIIFQISPQTSQFFFIPSFPKQIQLQPNESAENWRQLEFQCWNCRWVYFQRIFRGHTANAIAFKNNELRFFFIAIYVPLEKTCRRANKKDRRGEKWGKSKLNREDFFVYEIKKMLAHEFKWE